jgi:hypothetical protein
MSEEKNKVWKVSINYIHGQSFYPRLIFEGTYYMGTIETIAKSISENISPYWEGKDNDNFFIECNNEEMKGKLISEIIRNQPKFEVISKKNISGCDFGYNLLVNQEEIENK